MGLMLGEIIDRVLAEANGLLTTNEMTRRIYQTTTDEEFSRVRNSLSAELRLGIKRSSPTWRKIGRNAYIAAQLKSEEIA